MSVPNSQSIPPPHPHPSPPVTISYQWDALNKETESHPKEKLKLVQQLVEDQFVLEVGMMKLTAVELINLYWKLTKTTLVNHLILTQS